jgi:predicted DNA-binding protein
MARLAPRPPLLQVELTHELHERLKRARKATGLSHAALTRLAVKKLLDELDSGRLYLADLAAGTGENGTER